MKNIATNDDKNLNGGCMCGAVRFQVNQQPQWVAHCHCPLCRKMSGSPLSTGLMYRASDIEWAGQLKSYESSPGIFRAFCENCGSSIAFREAAAPEKDVLLLGVFDEPSKIKVTDNVHHIYAKNELDWFHVDDGFPRIEELPGSLFKIK